MVTRHTLNSLSNCEIGGYNVQQELRHDETFLAMGPGGRKVVLKRLDSDCLLGKGLHPSISERLGRVRELAHVGVANLHAVIRDENGDFLVWEYVEGQTFEQYIRSPNCTAGDLLVLAREIILHVESLHMQGIVHGAISPTNVIIGEGLMVRLTHVSPLLYSEVGADVEAVINLLRQGIYHRSQGESSLGLLLSRAAAEAMTLRSLGSQVAVLLESGRLREVQQRSPRKSIRRRTILQALLVAAIGLLLGYGVWRAFTPGRHLVLWPTASPTQ